LHAGFFVVTNRHAAAAGKTPYTPPPPPPHTYISLEILDTEQTGGKTKPGAVRRLQRPRLGAPDAVDGAASADPGDEAVDSARLGRGGRVVWGSEIGAPNMLVNLV
jgi:hypothetical protein